jgi:hypothetical protein
MKTKVAILVFLSILLFSCAPATPTQEDEVMEIATEEIVTEEPISQPITTEEPIVTEEPTETPIACVTLLSPVNGEEIPPVGKVTFSWTALDEAGKYVLNIILPSGDIVPFETDQTVYDRYMEAFTFGGEYQWQVVAKGVDGSEICVSEVAKFDKSAYNPPKDNGNGGVNEDNGNNDGGGCVDSCGPPGGGGH